MDADAFVVRSRGAGVACRTGERGRDAPAPPLVNQTFFDQQWCRRRRPVSRAGLALTDPIMSKRRPERFSAPPPAVVPARAPTWPVWLSRGAARADDGGRRGAGDDARVAARARSTCSRVRGGARGTGAGELMLDLLACVPALLLLVRRAFDRTFALRPTWAAPCRWHRARGVGRAQHRVGRRQVRRRGLRGPPAGGVRAALVDRALVTTWLRPARGGRLLRAAVGDGRAGDLLPVGRTGRSARVDAPPRRSCASGGTPTRSRRGSSRTG